MDTPEAKTRKNLIDPKLRKAGWNLEDLTQVVQEFPIPFKADTKKIQMPGDIVSETEDEYSACHYCDYALLGKDQKPLAIVEAKKMEADARIGEEQAKQYVRGAAEIYHCEAPFVFYSNGTDIYFWNLGEYPPYKVYGFPTRSDLERMAFIRANKVELAKEFIDTKIAGRPYQIQAIRSIMEGLEDRRRKFLLVMATGTGKTRTAIALVDVLMRAGWISRVLFLVDRIELRNQAVEAFKDYAPNYSVWPALQDKGFVRDRRVYVSTYQTMMNVMEEEKNELSPHFFDLVIVDESHRSIYNVYQNVLHYFNAFVLGLTATPTDAIDHNTFGLFDCEDGLPSFAYSFDDALKDIPKYLNDFNVLKISTRFQVEGIHKNTISLEDQKKWILEGKDIDEIDFEGTALEKTVTNKGTNALLVREFMEECLKDANGVLPGKTIFFCMTKKHAYRMKEIFDQFYPQYRGELAKVIVSDDPRVYGKGGLIDQFKNNDTPRIAISVDMLDTGIDVREIVNLVFAKPVFSYTKFWQMIGRGTRILDANNLKPWCPEKDHFLIIDYWDNFEYFKLNPQGRESNPQLALPVRFFRTILDKLELVLSKDLPLLVRKETERLQSMIALLPQQDILIKDHAADLTRLKEEGFWTELGEEKIDFLRERIAPLMKTVSGVDFWDLRFQRNVLEASIALLEGNQEDLQAMQEIIMAQVQELPFSIHAVAEEKELIKNVLRDAYWYPVDEDKLEEMLQRLSPLMRYRKGIRGTGGKEVELNFQDVTYRKKTVEFGPENEVVTIRRYREMVEQKVKELSDTDLVLQKLKNGKKISEEEMEYLARLLHEQQPYVTLSLLQRVYDNRHVKFIQFIKYILGMEEIHSFSEVVAKEFENFIGHHNNLSSNQLRFLDILRHFIIDKGKVSRKDLVEAPFTQVHPNGILGVFKPFEINEIVELTERIIA